VIRAISQLIGSITQLIRSITQLIGSITQLIGSITQLIGSITQLIGLITQLIGAITQLIPSITQLIRVSTIPHFSRGQGADDSRESVKMRRTPISHALREIGSHPVTFNVDDRQIQRPEL
jgi:hypothetical protein